MNNSTLLSTIADHVPSLVAMYNITDGRYLYVNKTVKKILGYTPEEFRKGGAAFVSSLVHPEDLPVIMEKNQAALNRANSRPAGWSDNDEPIVSFEYRIKHKNGTWRWLLSDGTVFARSATGKVELVLNVSIDITERKKHEDNVQTLKRDNQNQAETDFRTLIQAVEDYAIFSLDPNGNITSWNEGVEFILGYKENEIVGKHYSILFTPEDIATGIHQKELEEVKATGAKVKECLHIRKDSSTFHAIVTCYAIKDGQGNLKGFTKIMRDITEKKEAEETIRYQAFHDSLTGLSNREGLYETFDIFVSNAERHNNKVALIFLDLDRFKVINDTLGHAIGDLILKEAADRFQHAVRKNDCVARLGGDEFILLLNDVHDAQDVVHVAQKILQSLEPVIRVQNQSLHISASMGIAMLPDDGQDLNTLLKNADVALYRAKDGGRNRYQFYNLDMNLKSAEKLSLEQSLRAAVSGSQLEMVYQPYVEIASGNVIGVEALVRWNHPTLGVVNPGDFIPLAEETGMIGPIGNWIIHSVCAQGQKWHEQGMKFMISINLSPRQFADEKMVENISDILQKTQYNPNCLELEITESVAMENVARTSAKLADLKSKGIKISIDDFGTGYSSLNYLKRFPVHKLKIDKSFISQAIENSQDQAIVKAIISMGHSLGLIVCAEGIENREQLQMLALLECGLAQGYLISKPLKVDELSKWVKDYFPIR